jgi:hypothetical protein
LPKVQSWGQVEVARGESGVVYVQPVGEPAPPRTRGAAIDVCGGMVVVDVTQPDQPPRAVLDDPEWAQIWIASVYGPAVADAVVRVDHGGREEIVDAAKDYLSDVVARLGVGWWLHRWWPAPRPDIAPLDVGLLEIELGGLSWLAEACFVEPEPIAKLLVPQAEYLAEVSRSAQLNLTGAASEQFVDVFTRALRGVVEMSDPHTPGFDDCRHLLREIDSRDAAVASAMSGLDAFLQSLSETRHDLMPVGVGALAASGGSASVGPDTEIVDQEVGTVDWLQVAPRLVTSADGNVSWRVEQSPNSGAVLWVQVDRNLGSSEDDVVHARIYHDEDPIVFPLEPMGDVFLGQHDVDAETDPHSIVVDICSLEFARPPRISDRGRVAAQLDREEIAARIRERVMNAPRRRFDAATRLSPGAPFLAELVAAEVSRQS